MFIDDELQKFWRRTGYHLHRYKENYDKLPTAPALDSHLKKFEADFVDRDEPDIPFWKERHPNTFDEDFPEATGGYDGTRRGLLSSFTMKYLVRQYLQSKPGAQLIEHRALMQSVRQFYEDALNDDEKLQLRRLLISRLQMNKRANQYAKILGLYRVSAIEKWSLEQTSGKYEPTTFRKKRKIFFFFFLGELPSLASFISTLIPMARDPHIIASPHNLWEPPWPSLATVKEMWRLRLKALAGA